MSSPPSDSEVPQGEPPTTESKSSSGRLIVLALVVLAVGLGICFAFLPLGIILIVATLLALGWTGIALSLRAKDGRKLVSNEPIQIFSGTLVSIFLVLIASAIAFIATCFPIGLLGIDDGGAKPGKVNWMELAWIIGGVSAISAGALTSFYLFKRSRAKGTEDPLKKSRW